jgi:hypothetical protein
MHAHVSACQIWVVDCVLGYNNIFWLQYKGFELRRNAIWLRIRFNCCIKEDFEATIFVDDTYISNFDNF